MKRPNWKDVIFDVVILLWAVGVWFAYLYAIDGLGRP